MIAKQLLNPVAVKICDLHADPANARKHGAKNLDAIKASLHKFGQRKPIIVQREGMIVRAGNGTMEAAKALGWTEIAAVIFDEDNATASQYSIADNRSAELAEWDEETLASLLDGMDEQSKDLLGFDKDDLDELLESITPEVSVEEDEVPEPPAEPITKSGDLWLLGEHRVLCGDSTSAADVALLMNGKTADVCLTDPPYGIGDSVSEKNNYATYDDTAENLALLVDGFVPLAQGNARAVVLTPGNKNQHIYPRPTWTMAWFVPAVPGRGPWGFICWQPILCYGTDPKLSKGKGSHPDAIVHTESSEDFGHPCSKPIGFWSWLMERVTERGELVLDLFCGSGTTVSAAEQTGRICYGMEIDPRYCDVIVKRWETLTGKKATHG